MILVTGSSGLVGRNLVSRLRSLGIPHCGVDRSMLDLTLDDKLTDLITEPPDLIIHLAAAVPNGTSRKDDQVTGDETRRIDENVAKAAAKWQSRVFYASGCSLYNRQDVSVKDESSPVSARRGSPYSAAKLEGEQKFQSLQKSFVFRLSAPVGPHMNPALVLPNFITAAIENRPLEVWGTGLREQDFIDVSDVTSFIIKAANKKSLPKVLNMVSSEFYTMAELADLVLQTIGGGTRRQDEQKKDPLDGEYARYSNKLAFETLGWKPIKRISLSIAEISAHFTKDHY